MSIKSNIERIYLSPPDQTGLEPKILNEVLDSNWIAPMGPHLEKFEDIITEKLGYKYAIALNSATSALHLSLLLHDIGKGDEVICSTLTFCAAANAIVYVEGTPVFIDSEPNSWNIDVTSLENYLQTCQHVPKAIIVTHIYGMPADMQRIDELSIKYGFAVIHDLAESIGSKFKNRKPGSFCGCGVLSFNGNKLVTTGGGGALLTNNIDHCEKALYLSTQAKSQGKSYHHEQIGYNYRLSNVLAAIGIAQMSAFEEKINKKRLIFDRYKAAFKDSAFIKFQEESDGYFSDRWLTCILIDQEKSGASPSEIIRALELENIESRPAWKPMHLQPIYKNYKYIGGNVSSNIFENGVCLPSGTSLSNEDQQRVIAIVKKCISRPRVYQ